MKHARGAASDTDLTAEDLQELVAEFKQIFAENVDAAAYPSLVVDGAVQFPQDPSVQLQLAIEAVFGSWNNPRATLYRKQNKIADDLGTAVNVQSMVFGNSGDNSGTGVAFTRNPATGEKALFGEYLINAQGEDVVAGIRTPSPSRTCRSRCPRFMPSSWTLPTVWKIIIRTCRIWSSPSRMASSTCCRPVTASAPLPPL